MKAIIFQLLNFKDKENFFKKILEDKNALPTPQKPCKQEENGVQYLKHCKKPPSPNLEFYILCNYPSKVKKK